MFEPNPLAIFGLRRMDHCPPHFTCVDFDLRTDEKVVSDWIWENLRGRFWFGDFYQLEEINKPRLTLAKRVGFEEPAECSYFSLYLDVINQIE